MLNTELPDKDAVDKVNMDWEDRATDSLQTKRNNISLIYVYQNSK